MHSVHLLIVFPKHLEHRIGHGKHSYPSGYYFTGHEGWHCWDIK
jgi:hypothetical protein